VDPTIRYEAGLLSAQAQLLYLCSTYRCMHECKDLPPNKHSSKLWRPPGKPSADRIFNKARSDVQALIKEASGAHNCGTVLRKLGLAAAELTACKVRGTFEWAMDQESQDQIRAPRLHPKQVDLLLGDEEYKGLRWCFKICSDEHAGMRGDEGAVLVMVKCAEAAVYAIRYRFAVAASQTQGHSVTDKLFRLAQDTLVKATTLCGGCFSQLARDVHVRLLACHASHIRGAASLTHEYVKLLADARDVANALPQKKQWAAHSVIKMVDSGTQYTCQSVADSVMVFESMHAAVRGAAEGTMGLPYMR
jgi:hypothetical protein